MLLPMRRPGTVLAALVGLVLTGCGEGGAGGDVTTAEPAGTSLEITLHPGEGAPSEEWSLSCEPAGGTHPDPDAACATLDGLDPSVMEPVPPDQMCTQIYGGPQAATISGTWNGQPVDASFSRENGCEIARWDAVAEIVVDPGGVHQ